ncbi:MAG TPA: SsrA-binding protein SmpB [Thermomicrobiales bacterium]|nr:SsrA-binding protein SmpB [Thermomicrobiales bacterium]
MSTKTKQTAGKSAERGGRKVVTTNRRARFDYHIEEVIEAGIQLTGTEIKSIREGRANLQDSYAVIENGEVWLIGMHISPFEQASEYFNHDPRRPRKLLLHRRQIDYLQRQIQQKGFTLVPVALVLNRGLAKVDLALARGKRQYDKREAIAERDAQRRIERALRERG